MQESEVYERLKPIFQSVMDADVDLTSATTAADVEGWDSFTQIDLILAIEAEFGIRFKSSDLEKMHSVGDIVAFVRANPA